MILLSEFYSYLFVCCITSPVLLCSKECRSTEHYDEDDGNKEEKEMEMMGYSPNSSPCEMGVTTSSRSIKSDRTPTYLEDEKDYLDIEALKKKLEDTESAMTKIIARMSQIVPKTQVSLIILFVPSINFFPSFPSSTVCRSFVIRCLYVDRYPC